MSKRFTESTKWDDPWYRKLSPALKNFWDFICCRCDASGVWKPDFEMAKFFINSRIKQDVVVCAINDGKDRVRVLKNGYWQIIGWVLFQYGKDLNPRIGAHRGVIVQISKHLVFGYEYDGVTVRVTDTPIEMDKDKEKEMDKDKVLKVGDEDFSEFPHLTDDGFKLAYADYLEMRKKIRKPATKKAEKMALKELHKHTLDVAIKILDQSVMNSWQGIFPLKQEQVYKSVGTGINYDKAIESALGRLATKDMIKKVMLEIPENMWWKVDQYLKKRYPGGGNGFGQAEREIKNEQRDNLSKIGDLTGGICEAFKEG